MKKLLLLAFAVPVIACAQSYPSPTFNSLTLQNPLSVASGGTGTTTSTGTGSIVRGTAPTISNPTITGGFTATGLVTLPSLAVQSANTVIANVTGSSASPSAFVMPSCSTSSNALQWTNGTGFVCGSGFANVSGATFTGGLSLSYSNPFLLLNDTSGTNNTTIGFQSSGAYRWTLNNQSNNGPFVLSRFVSGSYVDNPISVSNSTGLVTFADGINSNSSNNAITGGSINNVPIGATTASTGAFTTLSASTANPTLYYNQGGTGAVNRTYQSKFKEIFDVKDFGAVGNGSTDDTTAQQNAINAACSNGGGIVYYPRGTYKTSSTLNLNCSNVRMIGETKIGSVIASSSTTADTLAIGTSTSTLSSIYVTSLGFVPSVTKTAGNEIHVIGNNTVIDLGDIFANGGFNAVQLDSYGSASLYKVHDFYFENQANQGLLVGTANGLLQDVFIYSGNVAGSSGGMYFQNVSGFYVNNVDVIASTGNGIQIVPVIGGEAVFGFFDTVLSDTSAGYGWLIQSNGTVLVTNIVCNKCWAAASSGTAGVYINAATAGKLNGITFQNSIIRGNQQHGIVVAAGTNIILNANQICSNSMSSSGGYDGIVISPGVTGFTITDNISGQCGYEGAGGTNNQAYGLVLNSSAATNNFIITNNRFPSNVTGGMSNAATGANQIVTNNLSF